MEVLTLRELVVAVIGSAGGIGGIMSVLAFIASRRDKRREYDLQNVSMSADVRRISLDEQKYNDSHWQSIAKHYEQENEKLRHKVDAQDRIIAKVSRAITKLDYDASRLRVAKMPDEAVDVINANIIKFKASIAIVQDALSEVSE